LFTHTAIGGGLADELKVLNPKYVEGLHGDYFCYTTIDFIPALCKINIEKHISASILHHEKKNTTHFSTFINAFFSQKSEPTLLQTEVNNQFAFIEMESNF
jgi:hypothetical protein